MEESIWQCQRRVVMKTVIHLKLWKTRQYTFVPITNLNGRKNEVRDQSDRIDTDIEDLDEMSNDRRFSQSAVFVYVLHWTFFETSQCEIGEVFNWLTCMKRIFDGIYLFGLNSFFVGWLLKTYKSCSCSSCCDFVWAPNSIDSCWSLIVCPSLAWWPYVVNRYSPPCLVKEWNSC